MSRHRRPVNQWPARLVWTGIATGVLALTATPAAAPPLPDGYAYGAFQSDAVLDAGQVIDPGPCTPATVRVNGQDWGYCIEDPTIVGPVIE